MTNFGIVQIGQLLEKAVIPRRTKRKHGVMDAVTRRRRKFFWCDICHKFNHNTHACYNNNDNWSIVDDGAPPVLPVEDLNDELTGTDAAEDGIVKVI